MKRDLCAASVVLAFPYTTSNFPFKFAISVLPPLFLQKENKAATFGLDSDFCSDGGLGLSKQVNPLQRPHLQASRRLGLPAWR